MSKKLIKYKGCGDHRRYRSPKGCGNGLKNSHPCLYRLLRHPLRVARGRHATFTHETYAREERRDCRLAFGCRNELWSRPGQRGNEGAIEPAERTCSLGSFLPLIINRLTLWQLHVHQGSRNMQIHRPSHDSLQTESKW